METVLYGLNQMVMIQGTLPRPRASKFNEPTPAESAAMAAWEDVQIDNQPQNLKKYQMYFKRRVIILTLGVYNLNVQKNFKCLQTF